jgi:hypothetical protein
MKLEIFARAFSAIFLVAFFTTAQAQEAKSLSGQAVDKELSTFFDSLAAQLRKAHVKKITILDLTDLQGATVPLGAFIADEATVNLASSTNSFAVVDRSNLNKILAEHKLSRTGLEEPENVKKLGHFSGVDAIVLGTITPLSDEVRFSVKIISTETADILGAAKGRLPKTADTATLINPIPVVSSQPTNVAELGQAQAQDSKEISQRFGDLTVVFERLQVLDQQTILVNLIFRNKSEKNAIGVGVYPEAVSGYYGGNGGPARPIPLRSTLLGSDGLRV